MIRKFRAEIGAIANLLTAVHQKTTALHKVIHEIGESTHHKMSSYPHGFRALAINDISSQMHQQNPLGLCELIHHLSETLH
jgi:hypothetical protein